MRYDVPGLDEAWTIVPLSLRITGYSPSPLPQYADRPTIHIEGEMGGAGHAPGDHQAHPHAHAHPGNMYVSDQYSMFAE